MMGADKSKVAFTFPTGEYNAVYSDSAVKLASAQPVSDERQASESGYRLNRTAYRLSGAHLREQAC